MEQIFLRVSRSLPSAHARGVLFACPEKWVSRRTCTNGNKSLGFRDASGIPCLQRRDNGRVDKAITRVASLAFHHRCARSIPSCGGRKTGRRKYVQVLPDDHRFDSFGLTALRCPRTACQEIVIAGCRAILPP